MMCLVFVLNVCLQYCLYKSRILRRKKHLGRPPRGCPDEALCSYTPILKPSLFYLSWLFSNVCKIRESCTAHAPRAAHAPSSPRAGRRLRSSPSCSVRPTRLPTFLFLLACQYIVRGDTVVTWLQDPRGLRDKGACLSWVPVRLPLTFLTLGPRREVALCLWETRSCFS